MASISKSTKAAILLLTIAILWPLASGDYFFAASAKGHGKVKSIGCSIWWDAEQTNQTTSVYWGVIEPGANSTVLLYVKNTGNAPVTLSMAASNWLPPEAANYMTMSWNYTGWIEQPSHIKPILFTLAVSSNVQNITDFSFDMIVIATG